MEMNLGEKMSNIIRNKEIKEYFNILSPNYPSFIDKYVNTSEMQRLATIGQFCGSDYTKLHNCKYWYSRLDHSIACALMTWHFTKDKKQTLAALFHDLGTPVFSHCVDYLLEDHIKQKSAEKDVKKILRGSKEIITFLQADVMLLEDVIDIERYTVVENSKPKICVDRLEGIFHTGLVWHQFWQLTDIAKIYQNIDVLINEEDELEIGFCDLKIAEEFFKGVFKYGIILQKNEDKFMMQFIADCLKELLVKGKIDFSSLYDMSEKEIIALFLSDENISEKWLAFAKAKKLWRSDEVVEDCYCVSVECKKRFAIPLVMVDDEVVRLDKVSNLCKNLIVEYANFNDSKYSYIEEIKLDDSCKNKVMKKNK